MHIKKSFFYLILVLIPFMLLLLAELILRITDYGDDLSIVAVVERGGQKFYTMNQLVGKRYFDKDRLYYRKGSHDFFEIEKHPNTLRIFCFGESTTAGFPFEYNAIPTEFLRTILKNSLPGKNIEVINTAIAATNSYTVSEFANELSEYQPDLFIIYMGQNEFYGAFGVGSAISIGKNRQLIKTYMWLQQFKTFILLKDIIASVTGIFKKHADEEEKLLMEQMAANNSIEHDSDDYLTAKESFKKNYEEIIQSAQQHKIPVLISTLITNDRDLPPFVSIYSEKLNEQLKKNRQNFYQSGVEAKNNDNFNAALEFFKQALSIDSAAAIIHYELAECYEKLGDHKKAEEEFILARDLDGLRFRAPSDFNKIIKDLSQKYNIPLADAEKTFRQNSPKGIVGNNLLIDHVHPNIKGYFLLAETWFNSIKENNFFGLSNDISLNDSILWNQSNITELDSAIGELKILKLKSEPPFSKVKNDFTFNPANFAEEIAYRYVIGQEMSWGEAHLQAAAEYEKNNNHEKVLKEYDAILVTDENNPFIIKLKGDLYYNLKMYGKAEEYYLQAFRLSEDPSIRYKLGLTSINLNKPEIAVRFLKYCLVPENAARFSPDELEEIHYNLALAYKDLKMVAYAVRELKIILENNPSNKEAQNLFTELEASAK